MAKIGILGAGLVGRAMAIDLMNRHDVTSFDIDEKNLSLLKGVGINTQELDVSDSKALKSVISGFDLIIGSVPGHMGFNMLKDVIEAGKNIVDISFFPEDPFELDELAKKHNVVAIMDCGVAPGMGSIILGYHNERMTINDYRCVVGGLPKRRVWPFEYRAVFSPADVIEEYTRPARYIQHSNLVVRPALSDLEKIHFESVGTLEAWNSDGLRSLIDTMPNIPNMIEKTLRYPGSMEYMEMLREAGFFSEEPVMVKGKEVIPLDVTSAIMFPQWKLEEGESEFTIMRINIDGDENGASASYQYDLYDEYDHTSKTSSMARTTGYTCTGAAELVLSGAYSHKGISPPEYLGKEKAHFEFMMNYLKERNVNYKVITH